MATVNKINQVASEQKLIAGVEKYLTKVRIHLAGETYVAKEVAQVLRARIKATQDAEAARGVWLGMVSKERQKHSETKHIVDGLRQILLLMFQADVAKLNEVGLAPRKRRASDPATLLAKAEKLRATRAARHTMGKRQRLAIKGDVHDTPPAVAAPPPPATTTTSTTTTNTSPAPAPPAVNGSSVVVTPSPAPPLNGTNGANGIAASGGH